MNIIREYMCDNNHDWSVVSASESTGDAVCPTCGFEAVVCQELIPADVVRIVIIPATVIVDKITGQQARVGRYFLEIRRHSEEVIRSSSEHYSLDKVSKFVLAFAGKSEERAITWFDRKPW